jgi:hypothetical protein
MKPGGQSIGYKFAAIPNVMLRDLRLTSDDKVVFGLLLTYDLPDSSGRRKGRAFPGGSQLAADAGLHRETVAKSLRRLADVHAILQVGKKGRAAEMSLTIEEYLANQPGGQTDTAKSEPHGQNDKLKHEPVGETVRYLSVKPSGQAEEPVGQTVTNIDREPSVAPAPYGSHEKQTTTEGPADEADDLLLSRSAPVGTDTQSLVEIILAASRNIDGTTLGADLVQVLIGEHGADRCRQQADWLAARNPLSNAAGLLLRAIRGNFSAPPSVAKTEHAAAAEAQWYAEHAARFALEAGLKEETDKLSLVEGAKFVDELPQGDAETNVRAHFLQRILTECLAPAFADADEATCSEVSNVAYTVLQHHDTPNIARRLLRVFDEPNPESVYFGLAKLADGG